MADASTFGEDLPRRQRLPNRRDSVAREFAWRGHCIRLHGHVDAAGRLLEIFPDRLRAKSGHELDGILADVGILISNLLQRGAPVAHLAARCVREGALVPPGRTMPPPASLVGALLEAAAALEADVARGEE